MKKYGGRTLRSMMTKGRRVASASKLWEGAPMNAFKAHEMYLKEYGKPAAPAKKKPATPPKRYYA